MSSRLYERIKTQLDSLRKEGTYKEYQYLVSSVGGRSTIEKYGDIVMQGFRYRMP
jgi:glycine C-acetyltransferase